MPRRRRPARPGALADLAPFRILTQIVVLQLLYYAVAGGLILFTTLVAGQRLSLDLLFSWRSVRGDVTSGWTLALCWMIDSLISVIFILLFIARSKLVPDFALTIHLINLVITSMYTRTLPNTFFWWGLQTASAGLMIVLGMWACQWRELKPIAFGGKGKSRADVRQDGPSLQAVDEEVGFTRGNGRGAGRDGAGIYEMVGLASKGEAG